MNNYLKVYNAKLHVLSPTFVGSGKEISKKEYRLSYGTQKAVVYDPAKFYEILSKQGKASQYENFLLNDRNSDLNEWMIKNQLKPAVFDSAIRYSIDFGDRLDSGNSKVQIMEFMKDAYDKPYVPGTSIKGMLRTILLGYEIKHNRGRYSTASASIENYQSDESNRYIFSKDIKNIESAAFNTLHKDEKNPNNAVNDVLQGLIISDSKPLHCENLVLCQKIDYLVDKTEQKLNILRESLKPGTDIEFTITIDSSVCKYDQETIMEAIKEFNEMYYGCFLSKFGSKSRPEDTVYLGGGVGFVSKTIIYPMLGSEKGTRVAQKVFKNTLSDKKYREHGHANDDKIGVSPHVLKCTRYREKRFQIGMCRFEMSEIKEQ